MSHSPSYELIRNIVGAVRGDIEESGGTVSLGGKSLPTTGYYVGGARKSLTYPRFVDVNGPEIVQFIGNANTEYVGWWVDSETGVIYIDAVDHYASERDALHLARVRGEIAVWDVAGEREIRV